MGIIRWIQNRTSTEPAEPVAKVEARPTFEALRFGDPARTRQLAQLVESVNGSGGTYHQLDFGGGLVIQGDYDMTRYLHHYGLPADLQDQTVLDIGTASGYFALECARRGARVTAIDIYDDPLLARLVATLDADIRYVRQSIYDLDADFGRFDLVICGSLLLHLPDQLGAVRKMRGICRERAIVATACTPDSGTNPRPICEFLGLKATDGDYWTYWSVSAPALRKMLHVAGFPQVENVSHFTLQSEPGRTEFATPHVVMMGIV